MNTDNIIALFCDVDDFCLKFEPQFNKKLIENGHKKRNRESNLCLSEVMTITICFHICFHMSAYRTSNTITHKSIKPSQMGFPQTGELQQVCRTHV